MADALPENVRAEAERVLRSRRNILVSGGTGSGKTTLLNALIELLPDDERIVAIEDTLELRIERSNCPAAASPEAGLVVRGGWQIEGLPATVLRAGPQAAERTVEFFIAQIRNPHTRAAYAAAVTRFFTWCDARGLALAELSPIAVATHYRTPAHWNQV